ncbi:MAG: ABC transporter permease [Bacillati bacterium ANGP1]|uniref:ABC transporter permease n=1 Tax=Candidatus Segetimicrobium genomatis TaxID=2569760 RepID=A0A537M803_9BACT|nr:MAG: ABC transporter permease [Terrabacteria group bacterium ANGP1]
MRFGRGVVGLLAVLVAWAAFSALSPFFLTGSNIMNVGSQVGPLAIAALGEMVVIITGGFDVSIGAVAALVTVVTAGALNAVGPAGILAAPLVGIACGAVNGILVSYGGVQPIIATLGMLSFARGFALILSGGSQAVMLRDTGALAWLGYGQLGGIPAGLAVTVVVILLLVSLLRGLRLGRWFYMVGSNRQAAELVGVPVKAAIAWAYALCGAAVSLTALFYLARASAGLPTEGTGLELQAIAAAVIGGASLTGGVGAPVPVFFGALFIQTLSNALDLAGISPFVKEVVLGAVIVFAGLIDYIIRKISETQPVGRDGRAPDTQTHVG